MTRLYRPQINLARPAAARMWLVSLCALLAIFQSSLTDSFRSLILAATAAVAALLTEALIYFRTDRAGTVKDGSAITSALILTLFLPNQLHPIYAAMGAAFAMTVVKQSFGGLGANWMNPAVGGWLFIRASWPQAFHKALVDSRLTRIAEGLGQGLIDTEGSPLGILKLMEMEYAAPNPVLDRFITSFLNDGLFSLAKLEFPRMYAELFNTAAPGIIADRGLLGLLIGTILISASQVSRSWIPAAYLAVYAIPVRLFGALSFGGAFGKGDLFFGLFSGGIIGAAFLLSADPATGPKSPAGAVAVAAAAGGLTFLFRYLGAEAYGAVFVIAVLNTAVPLIRDAESRRLYKTTDKRRSR